VDNLLDKLLRSASKPVNISLAAIASKTVNSNQFQKNEIKSIT
jgi:hypothetical protein